MTSRERVKKVLNHETPDRVPLDLGATPTTGISASSLAKLRGALGLDDCPVKVHEPYQLLGLVEDDVMDALGVDIVGIDMRSTFFGYANEGWKPWQLSDGTQVLVGAGFTTTVRT